MLRSSRSFLREQFIVPPEAGAMQLKAKPVHVTERALATSASRLIFVVEVGGRVDLLNVVEIVKGINELLHLFGIGA